MSDQLSRREFLSKAATGLAAFTFRPLIPVSGRSDTPDTAPVLEKTRSGGFFLPEIWGEVGTMAKMRVMIDPQTGQLVRTNPEAQENSAGRALPLSLVSLGIYHSIDVAAVIGHLFGQHYKSRPGLTGPEDGFLVTPVKDSDWLVAQLYDQNWFPRLFVCRLGDSIESKVCLSDMTRKIQNRQ